MKERPILFSAPMVRAILAGTKTQTRRIVKPSLHADTNTVEWNSAESAFVPWRLGTGTPNSGRRTGKPIRCPYGKPGDRLWVRETHARFSVGEGLDRLVPECVAYRATCDRDGGFEYVNSRGEAMRLKVTRWTPAIHMPRWASRITLEVTGVRVERLHNITEEDAKAEGVEPFVHPSGVTSYRDGFARLWSEINETFDEDRWVWVVEFRRVEAQERAA